MSSNFGPLITLNLYTVALLSEPTLNLFAYDAVQTFTAGDIARQQNVTKFYQELESRLASDRSAAVAYMREHLTDTELYDQKNLAELNGQRVMSSLLFNVSQSAVGYAVIESVAKQDGASYWFKSADKNVESMIKLTQVKEPTTVYMSFAVYGEQMRLFNEDFLRMKVRQMQELIDINPNLRVEFIISDDEYATAFPKAAQGIQVHSGDVMTLFLDAMLETPGQETNDRFGAWRAQAHENMGFRVVNVEAAVQREIANPGSVPVMAEYANETRSRKGGSIQYLLWMGEQLSHEQSDRRSYVAYTDADISTDMMQTGLLIHGIREGASAAIGTSEASTSVLASKSLGRKLKSLVYNILVNGLLQLSSATIPVTGRIASKRPWN